VGCVNVFVFKLFLLYLVKTKYTVLYMGNIGNRGFWIRGPYQNFSQRLANGCISLRIYKRNRLWPKNKLQHCNQIAYVK